MRWRRNPVLKLDGDPVRAAIAHAQRVPGNVYVAEARRQAGFQIPRVGSSTAAAEAGSDRNIALAEMVAAKGAVWLVPVPTDWILVDEEHLDAPRGARQRAIGCTTDPAFAYSGREYAGRPEDGFMRISNGNNRIACARERGATHFPVFVPDRAWQRVLEARGLLGTRANPRRR